MTGIPGLQWEGCLRRKLWDRAAYIFGGDKLFNLFLHPTTEHVFEN